MQRRGAGRPVEGAPEALAVHRHHPGPGGGEVRHEALEGGMERRRVQKPEDAAERVVARRAALQRQKLSQHLLLRLREVRHVHAALRPAQARAQRHKQNLLKIVPKPVAPPRILHPLESQPKPVHRY